MRRGFMLRGLAGTIVVAVLLSMAVLVPSTQADDEPSKCSVIPKKVASPSEVMLGDTVRVTLTMSSECPPEIAPVDVVLVMDVSSSMALSQKMENAKYAAHVFVDAMDLTSSRVGLVTFNHEAAIRSPLVDSTGEARLRSAIDSLIPGGQTNISAAIDLAHRMLTENANGSGQAMVVLTDGYNTTSGAEPVPDAAARAKTDGITVATFCAGGDCDPGLEPAASGPDFFFQVPDTTKLPELYRNLAGALQANSIATLTIRDEIPDNMRYVVGSAVPMPNRVGSAPSAFLEWDLVGDIPPEGLSYSLEPLDIGVHPTNVTAIGDFTDRRGRKGQTEFPIPEVTVKAPACVPQTLDVYFLIDDSNCLYGAVLNGMTSIDAIRYGVEKVLDEMVLGRDRGAVIAFGDRAVMLQPLTTDRQAIVDAVLAVAMRDDSARLDLAYAKVRADQAGPNHRSRAQAVTLFVTDGPIMPSLDLADQQSRLLRSTGVLNYGIAVGDLAQHALLRLVTEPGGYREVDFGGDLISRYADLATIIGPMGGICLPDPKLTVSPPATVQPGKTETATPPPHLVSLYLPVADRP